MRIEELVLEGFKSYPVRTVIQGWDPSFNAITGLNGSGKSNILDAISFVLGITSMTTMRASNQQDLIYKRGQAGVTKASVTIVFDNSDREKSPVGYEASKQITVTRQIALPNVSKFLLNGHKSTAQQIQNLFQSVQLNINNPNFVIMQGRITKVLNMRPKEILGLVEEAAGTRMYEERKDKALRTMAKKDKRVNEITAMLEEEIAPKLNKLRAEKKAFLELQKADRELERIGRFLRAYEWWHGTQRIKERGKEVENKEKSAEETKRKKENLKEDIKENEREKKKVEKRRDEESKKGGKLGKLEEEVANLDKDLEKIKTQMEIKQSSVKDEKKKIKEADDEIKRLEKQLADKQKDVDKINEKYTAIHDEHKAAQASLSKDETLLQSLLTGLSGNAANNNGGGYMGQISDARTRLAHAQTEEQQNRTKLAMHEKELKELEAKYKAVERESGDGKKRVAALQQELEKMRAKVASCGWDADKENQFEVKIRDARQQTRALAEKRDRVRQGLGGLDFDYPAPPNFDRSKVKGRLGSLIKLSEEHRDKATALELAAGGRLWNVVVEDEKVGKSLLSLNLRNRVTLIPLNKINTNKIPSQKVEAANGMAPGKVNLALNLVGYTKDVANAMIYTFGNTLICTDGDAAKKVTFARNINARSVTLEGDVYDPSGTLSGGAAPSSNGILLRVQEWINAEEELEGAQRKLQGLERQVEEAGQAREKWRTLTRDLEMKEHEVQLLTAQVEGSNAVQLGAQIERLRQICEECKAAIQTAVDQQTQADAEAKRLERDMKEFKDNKEGKITELKAKISKQKTAIQKASLTVKMMEKDRQTAMLETEQIEADIENARKDKDAVLDGIRKLEKEIEKQQEQTDRIQSKYDEAAAKLQQEKATLTKFDDQLRELDRTIKEKNEAISKADVDLTKIEHDIHKLEQDIATTEKHVEALEAEEPWIQEDKHLFNKPGKKYDFHNTDMKKEKERVAELEKQRDSKKKKVNTKVMSMLETQEKRETDNTRMLQTVLKDKKMIEDTIVSLDQYKREALQKTWDKVNSDFGPIFADLLPGNFAKLQPPEGMDLMDGLEVKVRLGSVWKQSLTELSGGQRSLIALSLIMALLRFKPAPMYILDEIDAALDLSHTQHIGQLFRTRFKGSQFIVVSLKEGLFANANVLFQTKFRDGTSVVERTAQRSSSTLYNS